MTVTRIVPNLTVTDPVAAQAPYLALGLRPVMDHGWIVTLADDAGRQLSLVTRDATAAVDAEVSIGVDDVDAAHAAVVAAGLEIVHPLSDEEWGVRRFFFRDADGHVINVVSHRGHHDPA